MSPLESANVLPCSEESSLARPSNSFWTVVANVEDEFDILITMNMQAEIETIGQLVDAVETLKART